MDYTLKIFLNLILIHINVKQLLQLHMQGHSSEAVGNNKQNRYAKLKSVFEKKRRYK